MKTFRQYIAKLEEIIKNNKVQLLIAGIASTVWFLVRVIPKPQRATYPCMRAAAPLMSGMLIYLISVSGAVFAFRKAKSLFSQKRFILAVLFVVIAVSSLLFFTKNKIESAYAGIQIAITLKSNEPIGTARGIFPGRVVWAHNPGVARWNSVDGNWWDDSLVSQSGTEKMLTQTLLSLTATDSEKKAWEALFLHFNKSKRNLNAGYAKGEKIAVKINENNSYAHANSKELNASPQMVYALLKSLTQEAGVPQHLITVFDASRFIQDNVFDKCHPDFPDVHYVDNVGGDGREKTTYVDNAIPYSVDNGKLARGLATCAVEADYMINMALLKGHVGQGITLCAKNYYGVTSIFNDWRLNAHNNFNKDPKGKPTYLTFVDFLGHKDLGEKTMLFLIDGLYGSKLVNGEPKPKWQMAPFNNDWTCSLFASQDGVAIDAVGLDFLRHEWPDAPDMPFAEMFLIEAAQADNPPSKTFYDPERDKTGLKSLGVYEHWNNAQDKQYSRNMGKNSGIELFQVVL